MADPKEPFEFEEPDDEPEIWDEYRWERFMQESDMRSEKYRRLLEKYIDHPDCEKIVAKEMGWDWIVDALEAQERGEIPEEDHDEDFFYDEMDEGDEWKHSTGYESFEFDSVKNLPVYQKAFQYGLNAAKLVEELGQNRQDEVLSDFVGSAMIPGAKISGGFAMGFDVYGLGGNIANCKRGLAAANRALSALEIMRDEGIIGKDAFTEYYRRGKEVRDELATYIDELRDRFERGIE